MAGLPARPAANTSSPDDSESLLFALNEIFLRQSAEIAAGVGIDLDSTLTTGPNDATCGPPTIDGEVVGQAVVDGEKGIDNAIGSLLLPTVGTALPCLEDNLALTQGRGIGTVLLWVRGWNGLDNDASVSVVLTNAVDATSEDPSLVGFTDSDPVNLVYLGQRETLEAPPPRWDNQDYWYLDPADFDADESGRPSLDLPKEPQLDAYVSYGRLVVLLRPGTAFELIAGDGSLPSDADMTIAVNGGYLLGDIDEERTGLAACSRPALEPCANAGSIPVDRCCPSEWSNGNTRAETCDTFEKLIKAARFDSLSNAIRVPVPEPELL